MSSYQSEERKDIDQRACCYCMATISKAFGRDRPGPRWRTSWHALHGLKRSVVTVLGTSNKGLEVQESLLWVSALLWHLNLKQSCERNTTVASRNNVLISLYFWSWGPATGPQNNPQMQVPDFFGARTAGSWTTYTRKNSEEEPGTKDHVN